MGYRLHSATKYDVKLDSNGYFNWNSECINRVIECLAEDTFWANDSEYFYDADILEADRETLLKNLPNILTPNWDWDGQEDLEQAIEDLEDIDRLYLYNGLKTLIAQSDPNNTFVHFVWF